MQKIYARACVYMCMHTYLYIYILCILFYFIFSFFFFCFVFYCQNRQVFSSVTDVSAKMQPTKYANANRMFASVSSSSCAFVVHFLEFGFDSFLQTMTKMTE